MWKYSKSFINPKLQISRGFVGYSYKVFKPSICNRFWFLIWSEVPKILTLLGALLVIASSLYFKRNST